MSGKWTIWVEDQPWRGSKRLWMQVVDPFRRTRGYVTGPLLITAMEPGEAPPDVATLSQSPEEAQDGVGDVDGFLQAALDAAWEHGLRPKAYADHAHELAAVRAHLADLRQLVSLPSGERLGD